MRIMRSSTLGIFTCTLLTLGVAGKSDAQPKGKKAAIAQSQPSELRSASVEKAEAAARALGEAKSPKAAESLLDALAIGLHPRVASAALRALAKHSKHDSFDVVAYYAHHRNAKVRSSAVEMLGTLQDKRATALVLAALRDSHKSVRATAAELLAQQKNKRAIEPLIALLKKGDQASALALAALANPDLARSLGELIGSAPDGLLARCLGAILMRPDFKPDEARVEVVKALGRIPGNDSLEQLTNYLGAIPEMPPRASRSEAESIVEARLGGS